MEKQRSILHCDLNNFYVSVACRDHPELKGKAVAVGGSTAERHGIILAKSEVAKKFGIQTGEPLWQARQKCPNLIIMPPEFKRYSYFSGEVRKIYERYTDLIEPFGIDECWLDVTGSRLLFGDGVTIADRLRSEIKKELDLTVSVGVSFNKIFAKLGSDLKKPDATSVIPPERFKEIVWPLEVESLLGVGRSTSKKLHDLAVFTVGDLATIDPEALRLRLGKNGVMLWHFANGEENSAVLKNDYIERPKSIGRSTTCPKDLYTFDEVYRVFLSLAEEVARELRKTNLQAEGLAVHIRTDKLEVKEFMTGLKMPLSAASMLAKEGIGLLKQNYDFERPLRSVGIRAIRLVDAGSCCQLSFFEDEMQIIKQDILETCVDKIRDRFGQASIVRASLLNDFKAFKDQAPTTLGRSRLSL